MALRAQAKLASQKVHSQHYIESLRLKRKVKALLAQKGPKAQKLFWALTNPRPHKSSGIEALESNGQLSTNPHSMALLVEAAFETKFNTSYNPSNESWIPPNPSVLGVPATVLGDTARSLLMDPISSEELSNAISQLDITKAEGLDNITNSMLKNTGPVGRASLLAVYVLISGLTPFTWKEGDIALILKKPPQTDVNNYRPITLISCVSKLLTQILAQQLSKAV